MEGILFFYMLFISIIAAVVFGVAWYSLLLACMLKKGLERLPFFCISVVAVFFGAGFIAILRTNSPDGYGYFVAAIGIVILFYGVFAFRLMKAHKKGCGS